MPGIYTTEFWGSAAAVLAAWILSFLDVIPPQYGAIASAVAAVLYAISRGIAKKDNDLRLGYKTSEFWLSVLAILGMAVAAVPGALPASVATIVSATVVAGYAIARALAKPTTGSM
jgi:magnesium-transporting ATPase (P-type)